MPCATWQGLSILHEGSRPHADVLLGLMLVTGGQPNEPNGIELWRTELGGRVVGR